jgi:hypothetical protein
MADYTGNNIFEKIGAFIPGYKGYSEKEGRRDNDKLLRLEIAKQLDHMKEIVNNVIRQQADNKKIDTINDLDRIKRKLDIAANQVRFANYGESGFFDIVQVDKTALDSLYQYDLEIKEAIGQLLLKINSLQSSENIKNYSLSLVNDLDALSEKMTHRDKVIMEVK